MSSSEYPLVSIIIPCYNAEQWLAETVACCVNQTYRPLEIIIIDDGSKDGSLPAIQQLVQQHPDLIRYETGANRGGCAARNRGTALAQGEFLLFFDADDLLEPETIAGEIETLAGRTDVIAACPWWSIEWDGSVWQRFDHRYAQVTDPLIGELKYGDYLPAPALLWHRSIVSALGGWDETLWANQDGDLRLRARLSGYEFVYSARRLYLSPSFDGHSFWRRESPRAGVSYSRHGKSRSGAARHQSPRSLPYRAVVRFSHHRLQNAAL